MRKMYNSEWLQEKLQKESWGLLLPRGKKDLEARWRHGASQHEEDTPRDVPAGLLGVYHQLVNKQVGN
jgi:hypothetical protein